MSNGNRTQERGTQGRPSTADIEAAERRKDRARTDPAWPVKEIFFKRRKDLARLFPKDGEAMVDRGIVLAAGEYLRLIGDGSKQVDAASLVEAALVAMRANLDPGIDVYLYPFGGKVKPTISPQGLIKLAYRGGFTKRFAARTVFAGDDFDYMQGSEEFVKHRPGEFIADPKDPDRTWANVIGAYAVCETTPGGLNIEVMNRARLEYCRSLSPSLSRPDSLWRKFPAEAARKAVAKQGLRWIPQAPLPSFAVHDDAEGYDIPDEIMAAVRGRVEIPGDPGAPAAQEPEMVYQGANGGQAREMGQEG